ncbi:tumor necrosis factor receptor superfamily member 6B isoform X2 [Elephas maximus indicus]|uniref:tumor necrosis factor receptor superfamily member 6B isoform X2 n=1 Tax=Elephas maximus indicus TaxID=99487 RepID=UPI0021162D20|nr:tumor necrosis factor receptor superfamily member 6B isoform X2 [Elephas maximus indicus]
MKVTEETGQALSWALPALLLALVVRGAATDAPTFPWRDAETREWLVCGQCPPGTFMLRPCSRGSPTACRACPPRHYTEFWNYLERCRYCNVICGEREEEVRPCTTTHNRACRCQPGFFAHAGFCLEHAQCPPGAGVVAPGTPSQNTQCQPCPLGTFSAGSSSSERCQPHRNCTALGLTLNVAGSSFHDALCTSCPNFSLSTLEPGELRLQPAVSGARPESSLEREALQVVSGAETALEAGHEECERALLDFVAFQDISFKRLLRLQQALAGQGGRRPPPPREEGRAALQLQLRQQLAELDARDGALGARLLLALRDARLAGLERSVRTRFFPAR